MTWRRKLLFTAITGLLVLAVLELGLALAAGMAERVARFLEPPWRLPDPPSALPDARLGLRSNPAYPGHDANGFRNESVPARADIVALGDSQTYGGGVTAAEAWPQRLGMLIGQVTYNMGVGGYGPGHSLLQLDKALALRPRLIIEGFYAGNDAWDCFDGVYNLGQWPARRSPDPKVQAKISELERLNPLRHSLDVMSGMAERPPGPVPGWRRFLSQYSRTWALGRRVWHELGKRLRALPILDFYADRGTATVFMPAYRARALDVRDVRVAEGRRICIDLLGDMNDAVTGQGVEFLVLLIPTKEYVFADRVQDPSPELAALALQEQEFWAETRHQLDRRGIPWVDALPALRAELAAARQPYPKTSDGHPNAGGQAAMAAAVAEVLR